MKDGRIEKEVVQKDKRKLEAKKPEPEPVEDNLPPELKMLMGSFRSLSSQQMNVLLIPFKAKQLLAHVLSNLTEEQLSSAESFLKSISSTISTANNSLASSTSIRRKAVADGTRNRLEIFPTESNRSSHNQESLPTTSIGHTRHFPTI